LLSAALALVPTRLAEPNCTVSNILPNSDIMEGYCPTIWATDLRSPRGIAIAANNDLLVSTTGAILALWDANGDGTSGPTERATLASQTGLNHGIVIDPVGGWLYASSVNTVYRWRYVAGDRGNLGASQTVITGLPSGGHSTRSLKFEPSYRYLYVSVGSDGNVDPDSRRSRVMRYFIADLDLPVPWTNGELWADGLRNEIAINFDADGELWGVENGCDNLNRADLGGDIHNDNPSEELNHLTGAGRFYGYPYCWTEFNLPIYGLGAGTQWVHPQFQNSAPYSDAWCRNTNNNVPPAYAFAAHMAPIDVVFDEQDKDAFSAAYVSFHGSWNRNPAIGYRLDYLWNDGARYSSLPFLQSTANPPSARNWLRPAGLGFIQCQQGLDARCLIMGDDTGGRLISIFRDS